MVKKNRLSELKHKKVAIFGYGAEGKSLLKYLLDKQIRNLVVFDEKKIPEADKRFLIRNKIGAIGGPFENNNYQAIEFAFRSPGVKRDRLEHLLKKGVEISTPTNLFFSLCRGKTIGVTGTKGKSTTVQLIRAMLASQKIKIFSGGNIGSPMLDFVAQTTEDSISVIELSSFQLEDLQTSPDIAVILPIFIDHLDYHHGLKDYLKAKSAIVRYMSPDNIIVTAFQDNNIELIEKSQAKIYYFSDRPCSEQGCHILADKVICEDNDERREYDEILSLSKLNKIPPPDVLATMTLAFVLKIEFKGNQILGDFRKLPFRLELVYQKNGLRYYNDSASTNPISTIAAIKTMSEKFVLILGGSSKNLEFENLAKEMTKNKYLARVFLMGETGPEIKRELALAKFKSEIIEMNNLASIIQKIKATKNKEFSAVLFSPASASFDQFKNASQRGEVFNQLVQI